ncbi:hypothetical protein EEB14_52390 [Rhodococcus sp. WS4]|nr:hypothetical protein EEB14_52390 [Rhodococcus sp. WS4]
MEDRILREVGRMAIAAGNVEVTAYMFVWALMYSDFSKTEAVVGKLGFAQTVDLGGRLADAFWPDPKKLADWITREKWPDQPTIRGEIRDWASKSKKFMERRNAILHSGALGSNPLERYRPSSQSSVVLDESELVELANAGEELVETGIELVERIRHSLPAHDRPLRDLVDILAADQANP